MNKRQKMKLNRMFRSYKNEKNTQRVKAKRMMKVLDACIGIFEPLDDGVEYIEATMRSAKCVNDSERN